MMKWEIRIHTCNKHEATLQVVLLRDVTAKTHILITADC